MRMLCVSDRERGYVSLHRTEQGFTYLFSCKPGALIFPSSGLWSGVICVVLLTRELFMIQHFTSQRAMARKIICISSLIYFSQIERFDKIPKLALIMRGLEV